MYVGGDTPGSWPSMYNESADHQGLEQLPLVPLDDDSGPSPQDNLESLLGFGDQLAEGYTLVNGVVPYGYEYLNGLHGFSEFNINPSPTSRPTLPYFSHQSWPSANPLSNLPGSTSAPDQLIAWTPDFTPNDLSLSNTQSHQQYVVEWLDMTHTPLGYSRNVALREVEAINSPPVHPYAPPFLAQPEDDSLDDFITNFCHTSQQ
jgi:hypothetical protein